MAWNKNSGYGQAMLNMISSQVPAFGNILVVLNSSNTDESNYEHLQDIMTPDNDGFARFYTSLEDAYAAAESNNNDVILLDANSTHTVANQIAWSKNRIHVFGMDGGGRLTQQGAKVASTDTAGDASVIKVTGTRNSFRNIKFIQNDTDAAALYVVEAAGEGNLFEDCSFIFGVADNLDLTTSTELLCGEDAGTFRRCSFGTDVLLTSAARSVVTLDAVSGGNADGAKSNRFDSCEFFVQSSSATATLLSLADTAGAKFLNKFTDCSFVAVLNNTNSAAAITNAVASASGFVEGSIVFEYPRSANCTNFCAGTTDNVIVTAPASSSNAFEGQTPA